MRRPHLSDLLRQIETILTSTSTGLFSYEEIYRQVYLYCTIVDGIDGIHDAIRFQNPQAPSHAHTLVHDDIPSLHTSLVLSGRIFLGGSTDSARILYDILLYPMRVSKLSFDRFQTILRSHMMQHLRPLRYILIRQLTGIAH